MEESIKVVQALLIETYEDLTKVDVNNIINMIIKIKQGAEE